MLFEASLVGWLDVFLAETTGELSSCALVINPVLSNVDLARHVRGTDKAMTN